MALVTRGRLVSLDRAAPYEVFKGRLYIDPSGTIERVVPGGSTPPTGYEAAPDIDVGDAFVVPACSICITTSATALCARNRAGAERRESGGLWCHDNSRIPAPSERKKSAQRLPHSPVPGASAPKTIITCGA